MINENNLNKQKGLYLRNKWLTNLWFSISRWQINPIRWKGNKCKAIWNLWRPQLRFTASQPAIMISKTHQTFPTRNSKIRIIVTSQYFKSGAKKTWLASPAHLTISAAPINEKEQWILRDYQGPCPASHFTTISNCSQSQDATNFQWSTSRDRTGVAFAWK